MATTVFQVVLTIREWCCMGKWVLSWGLVEMRHTLLFPYLRGCVQNLHRVYRAQSTPHFLWHRLWINTSKIHVVQGVFNCLPSMQPSATFNIYCNYYLLNIYRCIQRFHEWLAQQTASFLLQYLVSLICLFTSTCPPPQARSMLRLNPMAC